MADNGLARFLVGALLGGGLMVWLPVDPVLTASGKGEAGLMFVRNEAWAVCTIVNGNCDCPALQPWFGANASSAQKIASQESGCTPNPVPNIAACEYSVGMFQFNITDCTAAAGCIVGVDCLSHLWAATCNRTWTCPVNGDSVTLSAGTQAQCRTLLEDPRTSKIIACEKSSGGANWSPWTSCGTCLGTCPGPDNTAGFCGPIGPVCGDGVCDAAGGEQCGTCSADCGVKTCVCTGF